MITRSTHAPTPAERLARYYEALPMSPGFHPQFHAARAARGLRIIDRSTSAPCLASAPTRLPVSLQPGRAGCAHPALFLEHFPDVTDPRDPSASLP